MTTTAPVPVAAPVAAARPSFGRGGRKGRVGSIFSGRLNAVGSSGEIGPTEVHRSDELGDDLVALGGEPDLVTDMDVDGREEPLDRFCCPLPRGGGEGARAAVELMRGRTGPRVGYSVEARFGRGTRVP